MNYKMELVNPITNEHRWILVSLSPAQDAAVKTLECAHLYLQALARPQIPEGFMHVDNGIRPVTLQ